MLHKLLSLLSPAAAAPARARKARSSAPTRGGGGGCARSRASLWACGAKGPAQPSARAALAWLQGWLPSLMQPPGAQPAATCCRLLGPEDAVFTHQKLLAFWIKPKLVPRLENTQDSKHERSSRPQAGVRREGGAGSGGGAGDLFLHGSRELPNPHGAQGPLPWQDNNQKAQRVR